VARIPNPKLNDLEREAVRTLLGSLFDAIVKGIGKLIKRRKARRNAS
jgi:hypothetical protein